MESAVEHPRPVAVRVAFIVVVVIVVASYVAQSVWGEPYPALTQPSFSYSAIRLDVPDAVPGGYATVVVRFSDGSTETYLDRELIPWTAGIPRDTIFGEAIIDRPEASPETASWLAGRIATLTKKTPVDATIRVHFVRVDAHTLERLVDTVRKQLVLPLGTNQ